MGAPHNKNRYGQTWDEIHTAVMHLELSNLTGVVKGAKDNVVISGGWAWCLMTPEHEEYKHAHDLKDIDLFVKPEFLGEYVEWLNLLDYAREHTKYDRLSPFYRYSKMIRGRGCGDDRIKVIEKKIIIDLFVKDVPSIITASGWRVAEPKFLSSLYGIHDPDSLLHGSGQCWSLHNALELIEKGEEVDNNPKLGDFRKWLSK